MGVGTVQEWLSKATMTSDDLQPPDGGGYLSPAQARQFIQVAIDESVLLRNANHFTSGAPKFEVPRVSLNQRILRRSAQATRLAEADRQSPSTDMVELSTELFKGEVNISDETFEDNIERGRFADRIARMTASAVGRDVEEIGIKGDTDRNVAGEGDIEEFSVNDGVIKRLTAGLPAGNQIDASALTSYEDVLSALIESMPSRYRRNMQSMRFYVSYDFFDGWHEVQTRRGTALGDRATTSAQAIPYRGIPIIPVPMLDGADSINTTAIDYGTYVVLIHPQNIYVGWHRRVRIEKWRDPREGYTSLIPSLRVDFAVGDPEFGAMATGVDTGALS